MNCEQVRQELELSFGVGAVSDEVAAHLQGCEACRAYQAGLERLVPSLGHDENIALSAEEIERSVRAVERRIEPETAKNVVSLGRFRPFVRAAAAVLVLGLAYGTYELGRQYGTPAPVEPATVAVDTGYGSVNAFLQSELDAEMDDNMVSALIHEYGSRTSLGASDALLEDISQEELEYLKEHFEVGDLL